jgi:ABC-type dipeptide/oligopeptide/nickel transport system ATPase component
MKLVYCWINNYLGIKNQGFNFGSEFTYEHTLSEGELSIQRTKNDNYIPDYFKTDGKGFENVTAIVGENGVGKSQILKSIIQLLADIPIYHEMVLVFEVNGSLKILDNLSSHSTKLSSDLNKINELERQSISKIYYNPVYDFSDGFPSGRINDISSSKILRDDIFNLQLENIDIIHRSQEIIRGFDFLKNITNIKSEQNNTFLPFKLPKYLNFKFYHNEGYVNLSSVYQSGIIDESDKSIQNQNLETLNSIYQDAYNIHEKSSKTPFDLFLIYYFKNVCENIKSRINASSTIILKYDSKINTQKTLIEFISNQIEYLQKSTSSNSESVFKDRYVESLKRFETNFKDQNKFQIEIDEKGDLAGKLVHDYSILISDFGINDPLLLIYWDGISTGELAFLNLFSRFYSISNFLINISKRKYLYFFIDEGELGFHFQWQKRYIETIIKGFSAIFQNGIDPPQLQLIFATHSPIVLSDMPKDHVVFLKKEKDSKTLTGKTLNNPDKTPKTFAANIHDILKHDFFMDNGFMGEHVKNKINEVIYFLNYEFILKDISIENKSELYDKIKPEGFISHYDIMRTESFYKDFKMTKSPLKIFLNQIDEPILKIKLFEMYFRALGESTEKGRIKAQVQIMNDRLTELNKLDSKND